MGTRHFLYWILTGPSFAVHAGLQCCAVEWLPSTWLTYQCQSAGTVRTRGPHEEAGGGPTRGPRARGRIFVLRPEWREVELLAVATSLPTPSRRNVLI
jgi:hypothetical protein